MRRIFTLLLFLFSLFGIGGSVYAGTVTAKASGSWSATGTWDTGVVPTSSDNVIVPSGYIVTIDGTTSTCLSLTVQNGGIVSQNASFYVCNLYINSGGVFKSATANGSTKSLFWGYLYTTAATPQIGDFTITNNGQFGGIVAGTADGIAVFYSELASNLTIDGTSTATCYLGRLLVNNGTTHTGSNDLNLNIKQNLYLTNGSFGFSLQNNKAFTTTTTRTCTIFPNYIVTCSANARFHTASSAAPSAAEGNIVYNIYGTLDLAAGGATYFDLFNSSATGSTQTITVNLGNGTNYAFLKLGRNINLKKYFTVQAITLNWNNPNSKVVFGGNGPIAITCSGYYNVAGAAYVDDARLFPSSIRNLSYENTSTSAALTLPVKVAVTEALDLYGYGQKLYAGTVSDATARTVTLGKLFNLNNNAYVVTTVSTPLTTVTSITLGAAGTWVKGATLTDASGNQYYCDESGLTAGSVNCNVGNSGVELTGAPINVTGNVISTLTSGQIARFANATIGGNVTNGAGTMTFGKSSSIAGNFTNAGLLSNVSGAAVTVAGTLTNTGTVTLASGLTTGDLVNNGTLTVGANELKVKGNVSGSNAIDAASGTVTFTGTTEQTNTSTISNIATLNINAGSKLINSGTITATTLNIKSNTSGTTGTYLDNGTTTATTANVQQYLPSGRNWYISSPVVNATSGVVTTDASNKLWKYNENETAPAWTSITATDEALSTLQGYVAKTAADGVITFTGTLNTGAISRTDMTRGTTGSKRGFYLVGNPYPSFVNWASVTAASANLLPTMWYRTKNSTSYVFDTYNATAGVGTNNNGVAPVTRYIAPMQAFWVRVDADGATGSLSFDNSMRTLQDDSLATNKLRSATVDDTRIIRLQVSNETHSDEAIVLLNSSASNDYDEYDSPKMSNDNAAIPEIYTQAGEEQVVINGLNDLANGRSLALGFRTGQSGSFSIKATEISNLDSETKVVLVDNLSNTEQDLTSGEAYRFISDSTNSAGRFAIVLKSASITTGVSSATDVRVSIYGNRGQVVINAKGLTNEVGSVYVTNLLGQKVVASSITGETTTLEINQGSGIYLVTVKLNGRTITQKVVLN